MSESGSEDRSGVEGRRLRPLRVRWLVGVVGVVLAPAAVGIAATRAPAGASQAEPTLHESAGSGPAAVPGEIVVGFRSGVDASERSAVRSAAEVSAKRNLLAPGAQLVKVERGQSVHDAIAELEARPDVRYAEPNWIYHATATTPNDPHFGNLWGLHNSGQTVNGAAGTADADIDAPEAWDRNKGSSSTVVAVVDSGVAWDHPDLAPNVWSNPGEIAGNQIDDDGNGKIDDVRGWDFVDRDNNPWDYDDHGTHVAGTIAARGNNSVGITGVAWQASIMPLRALDAFGSGTNADIADAFTYAADKGARVVNASLGGPFDSRLLSDAIGTHPNTLYVVSAGNDGQNNDTTAAYPCNNTWANLICVAATDNTDTLASFSNYGASSVDLAAPGVNIDSARPHFTDSFTDDFQTSLVNWTVQSGPWGRVSTSGSIWLTDSPGVNYADNADWAIRTTSKFDVGARSDCMLRFDYGTLLEDGDWLSVQSSTDATTWTDLGTIGDTDGAVEQAFYTLAAGGSRYYRFRLTSDASGNESGVFVDNVRIACPGGTYGGGDYQFKNGTSMAAPHVAGAATVLFSNTPAATVGEVKAALLNGGDAIAGLSGKTVSGRRLNLDAALRSLVHKAGATATIASHDPNPSLVNQSVTVKYSVTGASGTPTGNVTVTDGASSCTGTVAAGQCTITFAALGSRALVASYSGDANYGPGASASVSHRVGKIATTTTLTSDTPDPSDLGQAVTVRYSVTAESGTPTGFVRVSDGVDSCMARASAGSCTINLWTAGARKLTATYLEDSTFDASTSAQEPHTVNGIKTTTAITADDPDPSVVGEAVTVKYKVTGNVPGGGAPSGSVTVTDGSRSCTGTTDAGQCTITFATAGAKSLTASYAGDDLYAPSATSAAVSHQVNRADTAITITSDAPDPSDLGQAATVEFAVAPAAPGSGTPTGDVTVSDGVDSCTAAVATGRCAITLTTAGARTLTATYAGDANFNAGTSAGASHTVDRLATVSAITADDPDPSVVGQSVTVRYSVSATAGGGTPTGSVTVSDGNDSCTAAVAARQCALELTSAGARSLTVSYAGDATFKPSTSAAAAHIVNKANTTTTIGTRSADTSVTGQAVTVHYDVAPNAPGAGTPTGEVTVGDGTTSCTATVAAGECTLTFPSAGTRSLKATYAGDSRFNGSTSATESHGVNPADTTTTISADEPDASELGDPITVDYEVAPVAPGAGTPTGEVTVSDGVDSCTGTIAAGSCELTLTTTGARPLTARYGGDSNFNPSTSAAESHTVAPMATATSIDSVDPGASVVGQAVTVQYTVTAARGTPTGEVTISDGNDSCTADVAAGQCALTFHSAGEKRLTATYDGADTFRPSTSAVETHAVDRADTATAITADGPDASAPGAAVTVHYAVRVSEPGAGTPTGTVIVGDGVDSCSGTVAAGQCTVALTSAGSRALTARYAGDDNFNASDSPAEPHTVQPPNNPGGPPPAGNPPPPGTGGQPPAANPSPAHVVNAGQTHPTFRVSAKTQLAQISRRRAPVGTTFTYTLDTAATVRFDVTQPGRGRKADGKCVPVNKRNKLKPKCALQKGSLTFAGHGGLNTVRFAGWLSRSKKLTPGRYELTITAITPGVGATSQQLRFKIVR